MELELKEVNEEIAVVSRHNDEVSGKSLLSFLREYKYLLVHAVLNPKFASYYS